MLQFIIGARFTTLPITIFQTLSVYSTKWYKDYFWMIIIYERAPISRRSCNCVIIVLVQVLIRNWSGIDVTNIWNTSTPWFLKIYHRHQWRHQTLLSNCSIWPQFHILTASSSNYPFSFIPFWSSWLLWRYHRWNPSDPVSNKVF